MDQNEAVAVLSKSTLFSRMNQNELANLAKNSEKKSFEAGSTIIKTGEHGIGLYCILEGSVEVIQNDQVISKAGIGEYFGEIALFVEEAPRTADVIATADTTCMMLTRWNLRALISSEPAIALNMLEVLATRLSNSNQALCE